MTTPTFIPSPRSGLADVLLVLFLTLTTPVMAQTSAEQFSGPPGGPPDVRPNVQHVGLPERIRDRVLALAFTHDLTRTEAQALLVPMELAARRDLPVEPLLGKMEEGLAKRVPPERIAAALATLVARFTEFADILDALAPHVPKNRENALQRMHGLAALGIGPEVIQDYLDGHHSPAPGPALGLGQVLNALETRAGLTQNGVSPQEAERIVNAGLAAGYFQESGWDLARLARAAGDAGVPDEQISRSIQDTVEGRTDVRSAARELGVDLSVSPGRGHHGAGRQDGPRGGGARSGPRGGEGMPGGQGPGPGGAGGAGGQGSGGGSGGGPGGGGGSGSGGGGGAGGGGGGGGGGGAGGGGGGGR